MFNETASKAVYKKENDMMIYKEKWNKALKEIKPIEYIIYKNKQSF